MEKEITKRIALRVIGVITLGILTSIIMINVDTYSYLSKEATLNLGMRSIGSGDIIEYVNIKELDPAQIRLKKVNDLNYSPMITFTIEGEIDDYIMPIQPICLDTNKERRISIEINTNTVPQLQQSNKDRFAGKIRIIYLSGHIGIEKNVEFTKDYLLGKASKLTVIPQTLIQQIIPEQLQVEELPKVTEQLQGEELQPIIPEQIQEQQPEQVLPEQTQEEPQQPDQEMLEQAQDEPQPQEQEQQTTEE